MKPSRRSIRVLLTFAGGSVLAAAVLAASPTHAGTSPYSIDFHVISAGGSTLQNGCYRLSGTVGQPAPGYSSGGIYALIAGYWQTPTVGSDEVFFNGFEEC
ncbi:MAG TPA: hypothetical protein VFB32_12980 [Rudaea sp.]|nr:hypothetical protein [Rudaea sp.]